MRLAAAALAGWLAIAPATAHRLLNLATAHGVTIVEDDIFADFEPDPSPRYAALDGLGTESTPTLSDLFVALMSRESGVK